MTKYEWEVELKKCLYRLPKFEQDKVVEYYNELFYDMVDDGRTESEVIRDFGNPQDIAEKVMNDYNAGRGTVPPPNLNDLIAAPQVSAPRERTPNISQPRARETQSYGTVNNVNEQHQEGGTSVIRVLASVVLWIIVVGFYIGGISAIIGGVVAFGFAWTFVAESFSALIIALGSSILAIGAGSIIIWVGKEPLALAARAVAGRN